MSWFTGRSAARKRRRYRAGESIRIPVRLRGPKPFPRRWTWGTIDTAGTPLVYRRWYRVTAPVALTGFTLTRKDLDLSAPSAELLVVSRLRGANGGIVEAGVSESYADLFKEMLRATSRPAPVARPRKRRLTFAAKAGGLGLLWLGAWIYIAAAGAVVDATVVANDGEDYCDVRFTFDGATHEAGVDCVDTDVPGTTVRVLAMPEPFAGEAVHPGATAFFVGAFFLICVAPLTFDGIDKLRRSTTLPVPAGTPAVVATVDRPRLPPEELRYSLVAATAERRASEEDWWATSKPPIWRRWARGPRARIVADVVPHLLTPAVALLFASITGFTAWRVILTFDDANAREAVAVVDSVEGFVPPLPWDVEVRFEANGEPVTAYVTMTHDPDRGERQTIRYDPARPKVARVADDSDGTGRAILVSSLLTALAIGLLLWRAGVVTRRLRTLRRLRNDVPVSMRYVVVQGATGNTGLLLFAPAGDPPPEVVVGIDPPLPDIATTGSAEVRGVTRDGELVAVTTGEAFVYGVAEELDDEELVALVTGSLEDVEARFPDEGEPGLDDDPY